ncbi:Similar to Protein phosphatase 1 regulatory subunit 3C; acc. no. Q0VCR4 [Pyronema omphalodes CBS 100304]|uniref:Similar to Protein phosphatase 1 regulatory subunit 3C acc. no. Q0VCR4 n=1 Tax=Pyronema omphalodes (strain CBS 100304) TaxID=1076935 RepID=U4LLG1_PYROM|nr:Similar to Protein phosphatase 1 regulatory subunit 3C; acc. no. Q0VCR4 [Pyronema omphalodes CBS 100304]
MPYTPPAQSPGATPSSSRSSSFSNHDPRSRSTLNLLDSNNPPRSATYLHKHRRSSSGTLPPFQTPVQQEYTHTPSARPRAATVPNVVDPRNNGSIHMSPPPVDNGLLPMPTGAFMSPPDSQQNSSDEEDISMRRGRDLGQLEDELKEAIMKLPQQRFPSPERQEAAVEVQVGRGRVSHQRTRSEPMLIDIAVRARSGSHSSSISDIEDDAYRIAPAMIRKKSGEVVKSSLKSPGRSRPTSVPSTPTFPKNVHFDNSRIEHVRHFLHSEKPSAVSVGSSPVEGVYDAESEYPFGCDDEPTYDIIMPNMPKDMESRKGLPVWLAKCCLSTDKKNLIGTVGVANYAFQKHVVARFTFDYWQTVSEVSAEYSSDVRRRERDDGADRFVFKIKLAEQANLENKTLFFCVRYNTNGQEFWDNNDGVNFQVDFKRTEPASRGPSRSALSSLPRSRPGMPSARPRSMPTMEQYEMMGNDFFNHMKGSDRSAKVKPPVGDEETALPTRRANPSGNAFGARYDFRASFNATVSSRGANQKVPTFDVSDSSSPTESYFNLPPPALMHIAPELSSTTPPISPSISGAGPPEVFGTDNFWSYEESNNKHPSIESPSYRELLDNYCFFGSSKATNNKAPPPKPESKRDSARDSAEKIKESLQILLPTANIERSGSPVVGYLSSPTTQTLNVPSQKTSGNASPIPLNYAGYHHRRRGSGAFRFDATHATTAIC